MNAWRPVAGTLVLAAVGLTVTDVCGQSTSPDWTRVEPGLATAFPDAHWSHPDYRLEWWYYTGNLAAADGRRVGFQLTFFRLGVEYEPVNPSRWTVRDLYVAHLAVTDIDGQMFRYAERMSRAGVGLAGAATDRYDVWNGPWRVTRDPSGRHRLLAVDDELGIDLALVETRAPVWHGLRGYSQKGRDPGNATQYYSLARLQTTGRVLMGDTWVDVEGLSWMDHEYGTSFLDAGQRGWDWFSVQLTNGDDLMVFQLRRSDGTRDPHSAGTLTRRDGSTERIGATAFRLDPVAWWTSPQSGARYPVGWRLSVPDLDLSLDVRAELDAQELVTSATAGVTYWEGAIRADGRAAGADTGGAGYLEMTGYAGPPISSVLR